MGMLVGAGPGGHAAVAPASPVIPSDHGTGCATSDKSAPIRP